MLRRLPPVYSPLSLGKVLSAVGSSLRRAEKAADALAGDLGARFSAAPVRLTASGTHALRLALEGVEGSSSSTGPVVAMPAYSCFDLVTAAVGAGVRVRFYDIDPLTLSPDAGSLESAVSEGVAAVVVGNLYGYPVDFRMLRQMSGAAHIRVIEDVAQGIGSSNSEGDTGTLGDATIVSFGRGKGWTGGGGGALLLRGDAGGAGSAPGSGSTGEGLSEGGAGLGRAAVTSAAWVLGRPWLYRIPTSIPGLGLGETRYHEPTPPRGISRFSAALALGTAEASMTAIPARRARAVKLGEALRGSERASSRVRVCEPCGGHESAAFLRLPVVASSARVAAALCAAGEDLGVATGYPTALHQLAQSGPITLSGQGPLPGAERLADCLVTFPTHRWVGDEVIRALVRLVEEVQA